MYELGNYGRITEKKIFNKNMKNIKACVPDGLNTELFKYG